MQHSISKPTVIVRRAIHDDKRIIWEWWNDPLTRKMMKKNDPVPWKEHDAWFDRVLLDPHKSLYIGVFQNKPVGVVRFDQKDSGVFEVSINMSPQIRGKGLGTATMAAAIRALSSDSIVVFLYAIIKKSNIASWRCFEKNGFVVSRFPGPRFPGLERFDETTENYLEFSLRSLER